MSFTTSASEMTNRLPIAEELPLFKILVIEYFVLARIQTISLFLILLENFAFISSVWFLKILNESVYMSGGKDLGERKMRVEKKHAISQHVLLTYF